MHILRSGHYENESARKQYVVTKTKIYNYTYTYVNTTVLSNKFSSSLFILIYYNGSTLIMITNPC